jgi:hypothetical protein
MMIGQKREGGSERDLDVANPQRVEEIQSVPRAAQVPQWLEELHGEAVAVRRLFSTNPK